MSFILDALRKSENDRQDSAPAEFTTVTSRGDTPATPRWLWILGGLLLINAVVLGFLLLRPGPAPIADVAPAFEDQPAPVSAPAPAAAAASFSARVAEARRDRPAREPVAQPQAVVVDEVVTDTTPQAASPSRAEAPATPARQTLLLPTLTDLRTDGTLNLPDMHLDIHVYSENTDDRFVFINMSKYREGSSTKEGPGITEITADGVVLDYQGTTFLLPRE